MRRVDDARVEADALGPLFSGRHVILSKMLSDLLRRVAGGSRDSSQDGGEARVAAELGAAIASLLRDPRPHPRHLNYETVSWIVAAVQASDYMVRHMMTASNLVHRLALLEFALGQCTVDGLVMEFGVYRGASMSFIAAHVDTAVHGFDSFEGLPEDWTYYQKQGRFDLGGKPPMLDRPNIHLHKGRFNDTLPQFLSTHSGPARFVHVDCDLYSSTRVVLDLLADRIVPGTILVFDEYLNYPGWREHEFRAFQEFCQQRNVKYRYIGFASADSSVALEVISYKDRG